MPLHKKYVIRHPPSNTSTLMQRDTHRTPAYI